MARKKIVPFEPWESKDCNGFERRYFRLGISMMSSEAMRTLSPSAFKVYCYMRIESGGRRSFTFPHAKYRTFMSKPTFFKALTELQEHGFVDVIQHNKNLRKANIYAFSDRWKQL